MNMIRLIACFAAGAALCGCTSSLPCRLTVSNATDSAISNVVVRTAGGVLYAAPLIAPKSKAGYQTVNADLPKSFDVHWQPSDGPALSRTVEAPGVIPMDFRGRIYFQIAAAEVKLFVLPDSSDQGSDMPWAKPESWEGFPALPGFTPE